MNSGKVAVAAVIAAVAATLLYFAFKGKKAQASGGMTLAISADPASGDVPLAVQFSSTVEGGQAPYTYLWDFGDGSTSTSADPSHAFTGASMFSVKCTVKDANGFSADATTKVSTSKQTTGGSGGTEVDWQAQNVDGQDMGGSYTISFYNDAAGTGTPLATATVQSGQGGSFSTDALGTDPSKLGITEHLYCTIEGAKGVWVVDASVNTNDTAGLVLPGQVGQLW